MKKITSLLISMVLFMPYVKGQTFAYTGNYPTAKPLSSILANSGKNNPKFHMSAESKVGLCITGAGIIIGGIGIEQYRTKPGRGYDGGKNGVAKTGAGMWLAGGIVAIMGSVFSIDGGIHDMHRYCKEHKLTISAPEGNQLGVTYNF